MIICPVCQTENDTYATTCTKCRSFLQNRIPNLDLFQTAWRVLESPRKAFHEIKLAEHKNYSVLLYGLFSVTLCFAATSWLRLGDRFESLLELIIKVLAIGVCLGFLLVLIVPTVHFVFARIAGGKAGWRDSMGLTAYAFVPIVLSFVVVLPIELLTFGMYLFTSNPPPLTIKPTSYVVLAGLDVVLALWSVGLAIRGTSIACQISAVKSVFAIVGTIILLGAMLWFGGASMVKSLG